MCDPMTIGVVASVAGGVVQGIGSLAAGREAAAGYEDRAAFMDRQAGMELQAGAYEKARVRANNDRQIADVTNDFMADGIAIEGSAAQVTQDMAREASLDEQAIIYGAKVQSGNLRFEAKLNRHNAKSARTGAAFQAIGSVIGGVTGAASSLGNRTMLQNPYAAA